MPTVPEEVKRRVNDCIAACTTKVQKHFGTAPTSITVTYDIDSSRLMGQAIGSTHIRLNPAVLMVATDEYITQTVPHEYAHCAVSHIYGRTTKSVYTKHGFRTKHEHHGPHWKNVMAVLGVPATRCCNIQLPEEMQHGRRHKTKHQYRCGTCGAVVVVGPKHHAAIQAGETLRHKACGGSSLTYIATAGKVSYQEARIANHQAAARPAEPAPAPAPARVRPVRLGTKQEQCIEWYKHYLYVPHQGSHRQMCIAVFMQEVGMTQAGASTYYNNCKKALGE